MNNRLTVLLGAVVALLVTIGLFGPRPTAPVLQSHPTTDDRGDSGLYAAHQFVLRNTIPSHSLRDTYDALDEPDVAPAARDNLLIVTLPFREPPTPEEIDELLDWLWSGNTLLALTASNDTPVWAESYGFENFEDQMLLLLNAALGEEAAPEDGANVPVLKSTAIRPAVAHPLFAGVDSLYTYTELPSSTWQLVTSSGAFYVPLANRADTESAAIWERRVGAGSILLSYQSTLISNKSLAAAENRDFLINLVQRYVGTTGSVIFDDYHHGVTNLYDPAKFFSDPRLHGTLVFALVLWLIYLLGATDRFSHQEPNSAAADERLHLQAMAGFIRRRVHPCDVGLAMYQRFFDAMRTNMRLPQNGEPVWQELRESPLVSQSLASALERDYRSLLRRESVDLVAIHNHIHHAKKGFR